MQESSTAEHTRDSAPISDLAEPELDLRRAFQVVVRRRWLIAAVAAAVLVSGVAYTIRTPAAFRATAKVIIEQAAPKVLGDVNDVYELGSGSYWTNKEYYETQYNVIRSRPVAERAALSLGLSAASLAEQLQAAGPEPLEAVAAADPFFGLPQQFRDKLALLGLDKESSREDTLAILKELDVAAYLQSKILVEPVKDSRIVTISVDDHYPERAAILANAVADAYTDYNLEQKVVATRSAVDWLSDQLQELRTKLHEAELALYDFKKNNDLVSMSIEDRQTTISQTLSQLNRALSDEQAKRIALEARRAQLQRAKDAATLFESVDEVISNRLVQELKGSYSKLKQEEAELALRYTEDHPKLIAVREKLQLVEAELRSEIDNILRSIEEDYNAALDTEKRLQTKIEEIKAEAIANNKKEIEYNKLRRERDNNEALYELVLKRQKEADLTQLLRANNVSKLEAALAPEEPIRPRVKFNLAASFVLGLLLALIAAFLVDYLDNTIKSQEQIEQLLGLPFLGILPTIKDVKGDEFAMVTQRDQYVIQHPRSSLAECSRTIRTNLLFMGHERPARRLLITSSSPKDGKSTTAINLAVTMAQAGARTVLVDTDMRRPRLHKSFGLDNDVGVSTLILGEAEFAGAVQPSGVPNLDLITCGPLPPNPAELLHTESFKKLVSELSVRYDRVLFDSPPVAAVADGLVLASMVDGAILVLHAGQSSWQAGQNAARRIADVGGKIFGVVLNDVDLDDKRSGEYYHYYYYRAGYSDEQPKKNPALT